VVLLYNALNPKDLLFDTLVEACHDLNMAKSGKIKIAARQLASLVQGHMDEAGLSAAEREQNVRALEIATAKIAGSREKSEVPVENVRGKRLVASR
jgi:hypothetical protein